MQRENIIKSINAPSLYGCETACANEQTFTCNIFSYRYTHFSSKRKRIDKCVQTTRCFLVCYPRYTFTSSMDNCHMGDKMIRQLDIFRDLVPDRDCDVFARNDLSQPGCQPARNWDTGEERFCCCLKRETDFSNKCLKKKLLSTNNRKLLLSENFYC